MKNFSENIMEIDEIINNFKNKKKLYHYTSFETGMKIILSQTLLFGRVSDLNDINELYRPIQSPQVGFENWVEADKLRDEYQQISLTEDTKYRMGFDIPAMWGHYASKGTGVCIVFDQDALLSKIPKNCKSKAITYRKEINPNLEVVRTAKGKVKIKEFNTLFIKSSDWKYEQEYRIIVHSDSSDRVKLPINDTMMAVIMRDVIDEKQHCQSDKFKMLSKIWDPHLIFDYGNFFNQSVLRDKDGEEIYPANENLIIDFDF